MAKEEVFVSIPRISVFVEGAPGGVVAKRDCAYCGPMMNEVSKRVLGFLLLPKQSESREDSSIHVLCRGITNGQRRVFRATKDGQAIDDSALAVINCPKARTRGRF